ncbi:MAG: hypothetical protein U0521_20845 [Anaerolineae bacterium]
MKHLFIFLVILTAFCAPVIAQDVPADPAAYLSAQTTAYLEIRSDDASLAAFDQQVARLAALSSVPAPAQVGFADLLTDIFPAGVDFRADVLPWLADRFAIADRPREQRHNSRFGADVRPADCRRRRSARLRREPRAAHRRARHPARRDGVPLRRHLLDGGERRRDLARRAPGAVKQVLPGTDGTLAQNPAYQRVRAALPADALATGYLSGAAVNQSIAEQQPETPPGSPSPAVLLEAALRLHPAQSPAEDALLQFPPLDGAGFAFRASADRLDLTAALSFDTSYPAPTLATATAGAALLDLIPGDTASSPSPRMTYRWRRSRSLGWCISVRPSAMCSPTSSPVWTARHPQRRLLPPRQRPRRRSPPTPSSPGAADHRAGGVAHGDVAGRAVRAGRRRVRGRRVPRRRSDHRRGTVSVFARPAAHPRHARSRFRADPDRSRQRDAAGRRRAPDHRRRGRISDRHARRRRASGARLINDNVLFVTMETSVPKVIASASQTAPSPALEWRAAFGDGQEALLYLDPRTIDLYSLGRQRVPPLPVTAVAGSLDARADGLFVLNLTVTVPSE